jgi:hypothetical protein
MSGHHLPNNGKTNVWLTPPHIVRSLGPFHLDPCAPASWPAKDPEGQVWPHAARCYREADDGLACYWEGRVWLNPPYGDQSTAWVAKLADHAERGWPHSGTALLFARTETKLFHEHIWPRAHAVLFLANRLHFHYPDGARASFNGGAPSVLIAYGRRDAARLAIAADAGELPGRYVNLK